MGYHLVPNKPLFPTGSAGIAVNHQQLIQRRQLGRKEIAEQLYREYLQIVKLNTWIITFLWYSLENNYIFATVELFDAHDLI